MVGIGAILAGTVAAFAGTGTMMAGADAVGIVMVGAAVTGIATVFGVGDLPTKALDAVDLMAVVAYTVGLASMTEEASTVEVVSMVVEAFTEVVAAFMVEVAPTVVVTVEADPTEAEAMADTVN